MMVDAESGTRMREVPAATPGSPSSFSHRSLILRLWEGQAAGVFPIDGLPHPMPPIATALLERYHAEQRSQR